MAGIDAASALPGILTVAERRAAGAAQRTAVPRLSHAVWTPPPDRPVPVALLQEADAQAYADQTERDHAALVAAVKSGRVRAEVGV